jgi:hypothetical protein
MKAIVTVIAGLGLAAAISSPRLAGNDEHQSLDRSILPSLNRATLRGDEVVGASERGLIGWIPGGRVLVGVVSVWNLVGLAALTITIGEVAGGSSSGCSPTAFGPGFEGFEEWGPKSVEGMRPAVVGRKARNANVSPFPIGHDRYAHDTKARRCWRNDRATPFRPARGRESKPRD